MSIEAMKLALEALESKYLVNCGAWRVQQDQAITALCQAIAEAEQAQPVAWMGTDLEGNPNKFRLNQFGSGVPLYTTSPQRKPLSDEEIWKALDDTDCTRPMLIARAIEAAHGIKENT